MRPCLRVGMLVCLAWLGVSPNTLAQTQSDLPDGPRVAGWVFTPSMGLGGAWDDNALLLDPADRPPPDYASPVSPSLSVDYTGRRTQFSSSYSGSWVFYRTLDALNSFDQTLRLTAQHRVTPRLALRGQGYRIAAPATDAILIAGVPFYRVGTRTYGGGGGFDAALSARTSLRGTYQLRSVAFDEDDPVGSLLHDGHVHESTWSLERALTGRFTLTGAYMFQRMSVEGSAIFPSALRPGATVPPADETVQERFNIQRGGLTAQYRVSPAWDISASLGVALLGAGLTHAAQTGPTWGMGVNRRGRVSVISAAYERSYVPAFGFGGTFQNQEFSGSIRVPFARRRAYVDGSVRVSENEPLEPNRPALQTLSIGSVLGYRVARWLNAETYYARARQDTRWPGGGKLGRNQLGFRLIAARPMRLR
jgi:hypothetical protein